MANITAQKKLEMQASGTKFGCHVEVDVGESVCNDCVLDYGAPDDCLYAKHHRTREACVWWRPVENS